MWSQMDSLRILAVTCLLQASASGRSMPRFGAPPSRYPGSYQQQNSLSPIGLYGGYGPVNWVKVVQRTSKVITVGQGNRVELKCEALGSPSPSIQWFKGSRPITPLQAFEESNDISGIKLGKVISRFIIECAQPSDEGAYTCMANAGIEEATTPPTTVIVEGNMPTMCNSIESSAPEIMISRPIAFETSNNDVFLPCSAQGVPQPKMFWLGEDDKVIDNKQDSRFKVMPSGDLVISRIRWADMGKYTCVAENKLGRDTATTFLYPLKQDA